jgi:signal transduction histidine kinase
LVQRLRLVGEIFTNALARKRGDEALRAQERALQKTREELRGLAARLIRAQEEERRRIAREMHDDWTQRLAVLAIETTKFEQQLGLSPPGRAQLQEIRVGLVSLAEDVHALSRQIHPSILDDLGLVEALRSECASFTRREGLEVHYQPAEAPTNVSKDVALCLYRVAQEALRNVAKHAAAREALVTLAIEGSDLVLRVQDHGAGFDPAAARSEQGLGLSSMHERVALIQATLSVTSSPGQGTTVEARVPMPRSDP